MGEIVLSIVGLMMLRVEEIPNKGRGYLALENIETEKVILEAHGKHD